MHVALADTQGNSNIGLYAYASNTHCILGPEAANLQPLIEEVLQVPVIVTTIAGTSLAGVFCIGKGNIICVPDITFEHEIAALKKGGIDVRVVQTTHTALGNNIALNEKGILAGPMFTEKELDRIGKELGLPVTQIQIANTEVVGSSIAANSIGCVSHANTSGLESDLIADTLKLERVRPGTINFGNPYVRGGLIANDHGFLVGKRSGGPEVTNADEAFGFIG